MPPSVNHYWGVNGKQRFIGKEGKQFRLAVAEAVAEAGIKLEGRLAIHIALFPANRRRFDIDNRIKPLLDALQNAGCFEDDEQIDELHINRQEITPGGRCTLIILPI
jgi:crossover junction endodeoxyribonuclease RusA